jgi:hypothetical protein
VVAARTILTTCNQLVFGATPHRVGRRPSVRRCPRALAKEGVNKRSPNSPGNHVSNWNASEAANNQ